MDPPGTDRSYPTLLGLGAALYALTALTNQGIVGIDDYASLTQRFLPAQAHSIEDIVTTAEFRSPAPIVAHFGLARVALGLGLDHPLAQLRFNQLVLGLLAFGLMAWAGHMVFAGYPATERRRDRHVFALFLGFYFFTPFIFTRPMIESLAAPWVLLCAAAAVAYFRDGSGRWLVLAVAGASVAAMMRPQAGVVLVALPIVIAMRRRWRDFAILGVAATGCFIATGLIDQAIVGGFHQSLREYFRFNLANSSSFGVAPWYRYLPLLLGLTLPPVFLSRYRGLDVRASYGPLAPIWLMLGIFLVAHSAVPHKEERFLIPALPLVLALLTPLAVHLLHAPGQRWRVGLFAVLNGAGLVLLTTSPLQRNVLQFAQWLDDNPRITSVVLAQFDVLLPTAYIAHPIVRKRGAAPLDSALAAPENCAGIIASLAATEPAVRLAESGRYRAVARFNPGLLEALVVWVNPRHNKRRGPIIAYSPINCPNG